tara:strand:- start:1389 stop:2441 length:1053 start_codon:yes stop_codon:yes gene_type:complete
MGQLTLAAGFFVFIILLHASLFYYFEYEAWKGSLTFFSSIWATMTTMTTVGYGDFYAKTTGGRLTTMVFGYAAGLSLFAWLASEILSVLLQQTERRRRGMLDTTFQDHILLINFPGAEKVRLLIDQLRSSPKTRHAPIVLINNQLDVLPFTIEDVQFVKGSVTDPETYERANIEDAKQAIILATNPDDPSTDALTVAIVTMIENIDPEIQTVAECVYQKHLPLFQHVNCDSIVFSGDFMMKMLVQEVQDSGTSSVISRLLDRKEDNEIYSIPLPKIGHGLNFRALLKTLTELDQLFLPIGYLRNNESVVNPPRDHTLEEGDKLLFISRDRPNPHVIEQALSKLKKETEKT